MLTMSESATVTVLTGSLVYTRFPIELELFTADYEPVRHR